MAVINNDYQTNLLFKRFTGVAATQLDAEFSNEPYRSIKNIFSRDILIEEIPNQAPISIYILDNSANWNDSDASGNASLDSSGNTFADLYPDSHLQFYKNVTLTSVAGSQNRVWRKLDSLGGNLLQDTLNFKYDDVNSSYLMRVKYQPNSVYINNSINSYPLFWVFDSESGFLQFYQTTTLLNSAANIPTNPPKISYFRYVGKKGLLNLDISGQAQVADISGQQTDLSGIQFKMDNINRMILPDGYVDISGGAPFDLSGSEVVRTYFNYVRSNAFIGYYNLPRVDGSGVVLHADDPSHNGIIYELDVSGNSYLSGNLVVKGDSQMEDVSANNMDISGTLTIGGELNLSCGPILDASRISFCNGAYIESSGNGHIHIEAGGSGKYAHLEGVQVKSGVIYSLQKLTMEDGSATQPSFAWGNGNHTSSYHNTGFYQPGGSQNMSVGIACSGEEIASFYHNASSGIKFFRDISMNMRQINNIRDATDLSGVPSWGQVQDLVAGGSGSYWTLNGSDLFYNTGNVGIGTNAPAAKLDVTGSTNIDGDTTIALDPQLSSIITDKNMYVRNTNLVDTLKISFDTFFTTIWEGMLQENILLTNTGDAAAVPTFSSAWGPTLIPIAYIDINQNYTPAVDPAARPFIANAVAYFTIKFAQPPKANSTPPGIIDWKAVQTNPPTPFKSFLGGLPEQTIHFVAGYIDNYLDPQAETRNPKPFIKILSTNIINQKCLTGITSDGVIAANIESLTNTFTYYSQNDPNAPKIGGIARIVIAEGLPDNPADKLIQNKVWLCIEQTWNHEPWQGSINKQTLTDLVSDHIIDVKMYQNNRGALSTTRNSSLWPSLPRTNTDWQLVAESQIKTGSIYAWHKFILPMGSNTNPPNVFGAGPPLPPGVPLPPHTLQVGGTPVPSGYPMIRPNANLWEVWLLHKDWPYGITTTEEIFENNVDICGNLTIDGATIAQTIVGTDITCNNLDALASVDIGPNNRLTITENKIHSKVSANGWAPHYPNYPGPYNPGLHFEAENFYFDCDDGVTRGFIVSLGDKTSNTIFRIVDNSNNYSSGSGTPALFQVEGSGYTQTQTLAPWIDMSYNIGNLSKRYKNFYIGSIDASGIIGVAGELIVNGETNLIGGVDISGNVDITGHTRLTDVSANNIDISDNLNVNGLITGVAETTFVEYQKRTDMGTGVPGWFCIARTKYTKNARALFILDDDTSGVREQIIFYAGASYSRGNYVNVIAHNWYGGPYYKNIRIDISGTYGGANLYVYKTAPGGSDVHIRLYQNGRPSSDGGRWVLTDMPHTSLNTTAINLDISYDPNNKNANSASSLDHYIQGDMAIIGDISVNNVITNNVITNRVDFISQAQSYTEKGLSLFAGTPSSSKPYVWGSQNIQYVNTSDLRNVGTYKQIRTAFYIWTGNEVISYSPPNNSVPPDVSANPSITPPCQTGGELFAIGKPHIWDLSNSNYNSTYHTFTIPKMVERTLMTIDFHIDIWFDSINASRVNVVEFWLGKNEGPATGYPVEGSGSGPSAYRLATFHPSYFGTNAMEPTYSHFASITLLGGESIPGSSHQGIDFKEGDTFYFTGQCSGSPTFPRYKNMRIKITWESLN